MRKGIHPLQRALTLINTKGASVTVLSVLRPPNGQVLLQSDTTTHAAWTGKRKDLAASGRAALFKQKFDLSLTDLRGSSRAQKAEQPAAPGAAAAAVASTGKSGGAAAQASKPAAPRKQR